MSRPNYQSLMAAARNAKVSREALNDALANNVPVSAIRHAISLKEKAHNAYINGNTSRYEDLYEEMLDWADEYDLDVDFTRYH